ncbi:helix-turn-helix domain-containing protein [Pseudomonas lactis]|uniref:helix-turn-helix domain-containing protein n=1 Tax=Pseudomonas TaxID=286 RepID=UPI000517D8EC|nr:helix-turn-helix transcriptional regulator [Pseudomonas lactis]
MQTNQNLRKTFGQRVRDLRNSQGFSQEAFADRCGFVRTYMSRIETGTANPSLEAAKVLADGLGLSLSELLQGL